MKHSGVGARVQTANSTRTTSEVTEYNNFNDDLLTSLLKEEKFGRLEQSQPFSPPLESSENTK